MCASHWICKFKGVMKVKASSAGLGEILGLSRAPGASPSRLMSNVSGAEKERICWDPKDGELCLSRMKPEETLVEVRSGSDVQIDRQT